MPEQRELQPQRKPGDRIADERQEESSKDKPPAGPIPMKDYGYNNPIRTPPLGVVCQLNICITANQVVMTGEVDGLIIGCELYCSVHFALVYCTARVFYLHCELFECVVAL